MQPWSVCSAQTTVSRGKWSFILRKVLYAGIEVVFITPRCGSIPPPATNGVNKFKDLQHTRKSRLARVVVKIVVGLLKNFASYDSKPSKILRFFTYLCAFLAVLGRTNPWVVCVMLDSSYYVGYFQSAPSRLLPIDETVATSSGIAHCLDGNSLLSKAAFEDLPNINRLLRRFEE